MTSSFRSSAQPAIRWQGKPLPIPAACALAIEEHRRGRLQNAIDILARILAKVPGYAEGHNNRGVMLQQLQRWPEALASYDQALAIKPGYANAWFNRGTVLKKLLRRDEALASYDRAIALDPNHVEAHNNRGVVLQELKFYAEALASYDRAIALNPHHAEAHNNRGIVLASQGNMVEAGKMFLRAAELKPAFADPLFNLANIRRHPQADDPEISRIHNLLNRPGLLPDETEQLYFSLGKIYDDGGRYDEAFDCFRRANEIRNRQVAYDPAFVEKMTGAIMSVFSADFLARPFELASPDASPLFIVGMPRSGTTLLANILSNHPAIATAGELPTLHDLVSNLPAAFPGTAPYPESVRQLSAPAADHLIAGYLRRLRRDAPPSVACIVDKNPLNFRHLGLIALLFPRARILHCTRHPAATCLSNYFQRFPLQLDFSFDLRNIAHFYRQYSRLMDHWHRIPGIKIYDVPYEDLVLRTEPAVRRLLAGLGFEWNARCLAPETNPAPVETASQWQVRQPIYQDSLAHWRHYEKHLAPLVDILPDIFLA